MLARRGILRRHHGDEALEEGTYLDLGAMSFEGEGEELATARSVVRMVEVIRFDDVQQAAKLAYQGDIAIVDFTSISNDPTSVRRMSLDLKNVAKDLNGDVAGIAKNLLCLTPNGIKIDRQKIRPEGFR